MGIMVNESKTRPWKRDLTYFGRKLEPFSRMSAIKSEPRPATYVLAVCRPRSQPTYSPQPSPPPSPPGTDGEEGDSSLEDDEHPAAFSDYDEKEPAATCLTFPEYVR